MTKYCITGQVILDFNQEIELTDEEYSKLNPYGTYRPGSDNFNTLYNNIYASDTDFEVDEYDLFDIEKIND